MDSKPEPLPQDPESVTAAAASFPSSSSALAAAPPRKRAAIVPSSPPQQQQQPQQQQAHLPIVPDTIYHAICFLGIADFLACLRVSHEFRGCARLRIGSKRNDLWRMAAEVFERANSFDVCSSCETKLCRSPKCSGEGRFSCNWAWKGDAAEAAADAAPWARNSFLRTDPRRRPAYAEQQPLVRLRQMVRFSRACVRRLRDYSMRGTGHVPRRSQQLVRRIWFGG
jgi:hypothetical protein